MEQTSCIFTNKASPLNRRVVQCSSQARIVEGRRRFTQYNPETDIFENDDFLAESRTPSRSPALLRSLLIDGTDLAELIDMGDTQLVRNLREEYPDLDACTRKRLQCICRSYGLVIFGSKSDLIERIVKYEEENNTHHRWTGTLPDFQQWMHRRLSHQSQ